ncbi:hypothetical protein E1A91_A12G201200v1 [Gossypium mustelinum]|uniref:Galactose oxidase-like Early set domain-containing protein n=1 Tax=Gossypium mustelinum TaxID=34275 RepID=A0A5D2WWP4_GOSMU|nr:hypothetical protein E1A91_A12G201200v1 [Gossypium mustelinum]
MGDKNHLLYVVTIHAILALLHFIVSDAVETLARAGGRQERWQLLRNNTGVVTMHMALTHENTVIIFDQTEAGPSQYRLHQRYNGRRCSTRSRADLKDGACYAHSVEYYIHGNNLRPLRFVSDPWCSSGSFLSNGTLLQVGGHGRGSQRIRYFRPCRDHLCNCSNRRGHCRVIDGMLRIYYCLNMIELLLLVEGMLIVTNLYLNYIPRTDLLIFLFCMTLMTRMVAETTSTLSFIFLLMVTSSSSPTVTPSFFNYQRNRVVKTFPRIPGGGFRNYPSSGSLVILPLDHQDRFQKVEVMVCGGATSGAYEAAARGRFLPALSSCGRMVITGNNHIWKMENMPRPRTMHDMLILPTGHILIINGARRGCAGWQNAATPLLRPYLYNPKKSRGQRFTVLKATRIARMYHSSALLLPDGRVLVAGGNPYNTYTFSNVAYPTELRLQAFVPDYMDRQFNDLRPGNVTVEYEGHSSGVAYGTAFTIHFWLGRRPSKDVEYSVYAPPFTTHSISMNQRLLKLRCRHTTRDGGGLMSAVLEAPSSPNVAPPGYYLLTVVNNGIPSLSQWVRFIPA